MEIHLQAMHQGVIRDMEQQRIKRERQLDFDLQRELEAEYKKQQTVRESDYDGVPPGPNGAAPITPGVARPASTAATATATAATAASASAEGR